MFSCPRWGEQYRTGNLAPPTRPERAVFRLRKWVILRLVSIVDTLHAEKEDDVIEEVARWDRLCPQLPIGTKELGLLPSPGLVSLEPEALGSSRQGQ